MKFGLNLPNVGVSARDLVNLIDEAEWAGWDGAFIWDALYVEEGHTPDERVMCDPWIVLAAAAARTERIHLGPIITPLARRRPWKVARETVTLDHLSRGRLILPVGLGAVDDGGFSKVGEETDRKVRAEKLDEALEVLTGLWSGRPFRFNGNHYRIQEMAFLPAPVQTPRIPIWVAGAWPREKSMQRAIRYDGILPEGLKPDGTRYDLSPDDIREMKVYIEARRALTSPFDIVIQDESPGADMRAAAAKVRPWADAGATWWLEAVWDMPRTQGGVAGMRRRIHQGPPRLG